MLFKRLKKRTEIKGKRVSPHQCRRYMATTQLASGRSPLDVQRQMGHTTLKMTNHYASLNLQQLKRSHEMHSPLAHRCEWRDNVHLLEHSEPVSEAPMFHQLAISDTEDVNPHHRDLFPRGRDASER